MAFWVVFHAKVETEVFQEGPRLERLLLEMPPSVNAEGLPTED